MMKINRIVLFTFLVLGTSLYVAAQSPPLVNQTDAGNLKQGYWERYYPNGKPMYQGYFRDDVPVGEMKRYYESGNLQAILDHKPRFQI